MDWIDALIAALREDPKRFSGEAERDEVLALYEQARVFYEARASPR